MSCINDEYNPDESDVQLAVEQSEQAALDLVATEVNCDQWRQPESPEICSLLSYGDSNFCEHRRDQAEFGFACAAGELNGDELLKKVFAPVVRHCQSLEFVDKIWGPKFADSFQQTTRRLIRFVEEHNRNHGGCPITIHTEQGERTANIETQLKNLNYPACIRVLFYEARRLPHDRFVRTNQIDLMVGRGLDFLSRRDNAVQDLNIHLKRREDVERQMAGIHPVQPPLEVPPYSN